LNLRISPSINLYLHLSTRLNRKKDKKKEEKEGQNGLEIEIWKSDFLPEVLVFIHWNLTDTLSIYLCNHVSRKVVGELPSAWTNQARGGRARLRSQVRHIHA
jgi:hypothetical protein